MIYKISLFFSLVILSSCLDNLSINENELIKDRLDSTSANKCLLFIKIGSATVGNSYQISIVSRQDKLSDTDVGNIFVADNHDSSISSDTSRVDFKWIGKDSLEISFDKKLRVFKRETKVNNVSIIYDTIRLSK